jgi:hypothetical protein
VVVAVSQNSSGWAVENWPVTLKTEKAGKVAQKIREILRTVATERHPGGGGDGGQGMFQIG